MNTYSRRTWLTASLAFMLPSPYASSSGRSTASSLVPLGGGQRQLQLFVIAYRSDLTVDEKLEEHISFRSPNMQRRSPKLVARLGKVDPIFVASGRRVAGHQRISADSDSPAAQFYIRWSGRPNDHAREVIPS